MPLTAGARFAEYVIERRIARGGMGEVYVGRHVVLNRRDAVKVLRPEYVQDEAFRRRFLREALAAAAIEHAAVVPVYNADECEGRLYLAMHLVHGRDLAEHLRDLGRLPLAESLRVLACVASALDAADAVGLVHRDVKPANVLLATATARVTTGEEPPTVFLADFGISRLRDDVTLTPKGSIVGSMPYIAPEHILARPLDGRVDQYSLACVAFELLTGRLPFPLGTSESLMHAHLTMPPPRASLVLGSLPVAVDEVLARALAKNPGDRYSSCGAFVVALRRAASPDPIGDGALSDRPLGPMQRTRNVDGPSEAVLLVTGGPCSGSVFALPAGRLVLGRGDDATIKLPDAFLSRQHLALEVDEDGTVHVEDLVSANGSALNGAPLRGKGRLDEGSILQAGASLLRLEQSRARTRGIDVDDGEPPDAAMVLASAGGTEAKRSPSSQEFLTLRLGWRSSRGDAVTVSLRANGLAISGNRTWVVAAGRWLLAQAAVLHSPQDLGIVVICDVADRNDWTWARSLPHLAALDDPSAASGFLEPDDVPSLMELVKERLVTSAEPKRALLVFDDGEPSFAGAWLADHGAAAGVYYVALRDLPEAAASMVIDGERGTFRLSGPEVRDTGTPDGLTGGVARRIAGMFV